MSTPNASANGSGTGNAPASGAAVNSGAADATATSASAVDRGFGAGRGFGIAMIILGAIGEFMSSLIMFDKIQMMLDPNYVPSCTLSETISCGDVMGSAQASAFGFPNPMIGMVGFAVVVTLGVVLAVGVRLPRWMWWAQVVGLGLGVVFVHWLAYSAIYVIGALCPYCMVVWAVMLPLFLMALIHTVREPKRQAFGAEAVPTGIGMPAFVLVVWYLAFLVLILAQFYI